MELAAPSTNSICNRLTHLVRYLNLIVNNHIKNYLHLNEKCIRKPIIHILWLFSNTLFSLINYPKMITSQTAIKCNFTIMFNRFLLFFG